MDALQSLVTDLNTLIPILNHWVHLSAAVIWVGGLAFLIMAVTPGLKKAVAKEQIKPITDAFYQHYKKVAGILLVVLLFTGGINFHYVNQLITCANRQRDPAPCEVPDRLLYQAVSRPLSSHALPLHGTLQVR